ncbi:P63C domain-containing protein [Chitinophaga solisilvae]|uniref:P63C domain-containing protein n=1 Tax=Chitinophaga solisilvae TaxID=1233460 RepID=UPI001923CAE7|nr:P63C domain-containing protein [Chitinophaga solisilvae]
MEKQILRATHEGVVKLGDVEMKVAILSDGTRVLNRISLLRAIGRTGKAKGGRKYDKQSTLPVFLTANSLEPFISPELIEDSKPINFIDLNNVELIGYKASLLPHICYVFIDAGEAGKLKSNQMHIFDQCKLLVRGFATVGMIALVDEATGYQYDRERFELQKILTAYISDEILKWQLTFTDEFYKQVYRLWGLSFIPKYIKNKPSFIGKLTTKYIYEQLPEGVLEKIKINTPKTEKGNWKYKFHQSLTPEIGREHLKKQIIEVTTLMSIAVSKEQFQQLFKMKYNKSIQLEMEFNEEIKPPTLNKFDASLQTALLTSIK